LTFRMVSLISLATCDPGQGIAVRWEVAIPLADQVPLRDMPTKSELPSGFHLKQL